MHLRRALIVELLVTQQLVFLIQKVITAIIVKGRKHGARHLQPTVCLQISKTGVLFREEVPLSFLRLAYAVQLEQDMRVLQKLASDLRPVRCWLGEMMRRS
jgi:hypothetical protein